MLCPENKTPFPNELQDFGHFEHELITQSERIGNLTHTDGYTDREREKENTAKSKRLTSNRRPWPDERYKNLTAVALRETHDNEESVSRMFQRTFRRASSHSVDPRFGLSLRPRKWLGLTVVAILVAPTMAVDDQIVPLSAHTAGEVDAHNIIPNVAFGTASGVIFLITGYLSSTTRTSVGPLMGISGVLWFIMRNDEAVKPSFAWM
ncbi:hypothetical protein CC86DRAFT_25642 [Ophiobolus disseminans]|uniref:Uncharacterized protein n=1 Tax=Ophiobolus disseminans TaxID=1469910 RepID=A0A6A7A072_9PLEO|nr:hypothetical protein CC86DRAFT_25642 [Ophiobolus disseminans]